MTSEQLNQFLHEEDSPFRNLRPHRDFGWILKECPFGRQDFTLLVHIPISETRTMLRFYLNKFDAKAPRGPWLRDRYESWRQQTDIRRMFPGTMPNKLQHKPNRGQEGELLDIDFSRSDVEPFGRWLDDILKFADSISEQWIETGLQWNTQYRTKVMDWLGRICTNVPNDLLQPPAQNNHEPPMINKIKDLLLSNLNVILTGAPGTGKTFMAKEVAQKIITERLPDDAKQQAMNERFKSVQFHPGYDYADFVVGMKPVLLSGEGKELEMKNGKYVDVETGAEVAAGEISKAQVSFRWKDGIFKTFADAARNAYDAAEDKENAPRFVFLVDEINRADLSRVFGELFSLLEEGYRYPNGKDSDFVLLPNGERFSIPKNLYVIGTMNDIDRSVESMDFALRRRFAWKEVKPEDTAADILAPIPQKKTLLAKMNAVNALIRSDDFRLGCEYQLGGAIFAKFKGDYEALWNNHISNILNEYLRGRRDRDERLKELKDAYNGGTDDAADEGEARTEDDANAGTAPRTRGANKKFRIVFQDGTEIGGAEKSGVESLVEFVGRVGHEQGFEQIAALGLVRGGKPFLIMGEVGEAEKPFYKQVAEGVFVCVYSGNDEKVSQIARIINEFSLHARVEYL